MIGYYVVNWLLHGIDLDHYMVLIKSWNTSEL